MGMSLYKCRRCGVYATSKCVRQRSVFATGLKGEQSDPEYDVLTLYLNNLLVDIDTHANGMEDGGTVTEIKLSARLYRDKDAEPVSHEQAFDALVRWLTGALKISEAATKCDLLHDGHRWVFVENGGRDSCMFGCCKVPQPVTATA